LKLKETKKNDSFKKNMWMSMIFRIYF